MTDSKQNARRGIVWITYGLSLLAGLYSSLKTTLLVFKNDGDTSHTLLLWQGIHAHGLNWLGDWLFTPDNWLLSLVPLHFAAFALFGATPQVAIVGGWAIMVASALLCGLIAWQLGAVQAAPAVTVVLLFLGIYAQAHGYVAYSISHNITNLLGLVATACLLAWLKQPRDRLLLGLGFALTCGGVSDPWMLATYQLPIALYALALPFLPSVVSRAHGLKLLAVSGFSIIATHGQLFGLLSFVQTLHFRLGDWATIQQNAVWLVRDLGGMLNLIPFQTGNAFIPATLSLLAITAALAWQLLYWVRSGSPRPEQLVLLVFVVLSCLSIGGISAAFVLSAVQDRDYSAPRFLINATYLIPLLFAVLLEHNWKRLPALGKGFGLALVAAFLLASLTSLVLAWNDQADNIQRRDTTGLMNFLAQQQLTYGYGHYQGANANGITAATGGKITIRPVAFHPGSGKVSFGGGVQTSKRWYEPSDIPAGQQTFFIVMTEEGCPSVAICEQGVTRQFGSPARALDYEDYRILVWNHDLLTYTPPLDPLPVTVGQPVRFDAGHDHAASMQGWSHPESWGVWSDGDQAGILLQLGHIPERDLALNLEGQVFLTEKHPNLEVAVNLNGQLLGTLHYGLPSEKTVRTLSIPVSLTQEQGGKMLLQFTFYSPKSPAEMGESMDRRRLGLGLFTLTLQ